MTNTFGRGEPMRIAMRRLLPQFVFAALLASTSAQGEEPRPTSASQTHTEAAAASFDCTRAQSARERLICGEPALSALDGQLGRLYRERRALLSPEGAKLLQMSELSWLRFIATVCATETSENLPRPGHRDCLKRQYTERIDELQNVAEKIGPFVFNRIDLYAAEPAPDPDGSVTGFYVQHVAYPQIDNADSSELSTWNQQNIRSLSKESDCDSDSGDYDLGYEVGYANSRLISIEWWNSTYCHGTAHGFGDVKIQNTVLAPRLRPLSSQDVFGAGDAWIPILQKTFWTTLNQSAWRPPEDQADKIKREFENDFVEPDRWLFTKDGLQIAFSSYEGGCYACTPQPVTLPWSSLEPLLSKNAVVP